MDEITLKGISGSIIPDDPGAVFKSKRLQLGYTGGISVADIPFNNLDVTLEYTKIYPYVYGHHDPAQTYTNSSYIMGHWIGHNGDIVHLEFNYRLIRGLQANIWGEYIRKGSSNYSGQYKKQSPEFLFGLKNYYRYFGVNIKYELLHELNIETKLRFNSTSFERETGSFLDKNINEFRFSIYYGL